MKNDIHADNIGIDEFGEIVREFRQKKLMAERIQAAMRFIYDGLYMDIWVTHGFTDEVRGIRAKNDVHKDFKPIRQFLKATDGVTFVIHQSKDWLTTINLHYQPGPTSVYHVDNSPWGMKSMVMEPEKYALTIHNPYLHKFISIMTAAHDHGAPVH